MAKIHSLTSYIGLAAKSVILLYQGLRFAILTKGRYDETFAGEDANL